MALVASALTSLAPLWQATRTAPNAVLTEGVRATAGGAVRRLSQVLVVAEIALAFTLLAVSVMLVAHLRNLGRVPIGLEPNGLLTFELVAPARVVASKSLGPYQKRLIEALEAVPGVTGAALANQLPLAGCCMGGTVHVEGMPTEHEARRVSFMFVTPGFLPTTGIPLRAGRFLTETDVREDVLPVVVNQAAANRYWPDRNPVGAYGTAESSRRQSISGDGRRGRYTERRSEQGSGGRAVPARRVVSGQPDAHVRALVATLGAGCRERPPRRASVDPHAGDARRADDERHRARLVAARARQLPGHAVLRDGGAAAGDARYLRRGRLRRSPADRSRWERAWRSAPSGGTC